MAVNQFNEATTFMPMTQRLKTPPTGRIYSADPTKFLFVASNLEPELDGGLPVALWSRDPAHGAGEVWVTGDTPVRVALTMEVRDKLHEGVLIEVEG